MLRAHVERYAANRGVVLGGLRACGITDVAPADGAFYVYADLGGDSGAGLPGLGSEALCACFLADEAVAMTPGTDFEDPALGRGAYRIRFSFPGAADDVVEAMARFARWWPGWKARVAEARAAAAGGECWL